MTELIEPIQQTSGVVLLLVWGYARYELFPSEWQERLTAIVFFGSVNVLTVTTLIRIWS
jgi:hypothetical protein